MKILNQVIFSIVLFILGGCTFDRDFIYERPGNDSDYNSQVFSNQQGNGKGVLSSEENLKESGGKHFEQDISLNPHKHLKIETYIPFPGKNEKKNILMADEYLAESDEGDLDNDFGRSLDRKIEVYIPFPKGFRKKKSYFTEEYLDEEYLEEEYLEEEYLEEQFSGYSDYSYSQDQYPQTYRSSTLSKHRKPKPYIPSPSQHQKPRASIPRPHKHQKPRASIPRPHKHQKPQASILKPSKHRKP